LTEFAEVSVMFRLFSEVENESRVENRVEDCVTVGRLSASIIREVRESPESALPGRKRRENDILRPKMEKDELNLNGEGGDDEV
jgi:hypothetical protein